MADHSRSVTFMIADGILPSNEGRGYVLRRLLRRAVMKGHLLGLDKPFLNEYVDEIVNLMGDVYPEIVENRELARRVILSEEERFGATLRQGRAFLDEALAGLEGEVLPGDAAPSRCTTPTASPWRSRASCAASVVSRWTWRASAAAWTSSASAPVRPIRRMPRRLGPRTAA